MLIPASFIYTCDTNFAHPNDGREKVFIVNYWPSFSSIIWNNLNRLNCAFIRNWYLSKWGNRAEEESTKPMEIYISIISSFFVCCNSWGWGVVSCFVLGYLIESPFFFYFVSLPLWSFLISPSYLCFVT